jgi:hypothetical protein
LIAAAQLAVLLATSNRYGYHRDEMYFIVAGQHPAFGYPDQPPLVPLLCAAMNGLAHGSLTMLRTPSALAAATTTLLAALVSRECGGRARAQVIAAACAAVSGFALAVGHFVTTTTFDLLSTTVLGWLMVRAVLRHSHVELLLAGVVVGVGIEAKPQVGLVAVVIVLALAAVGPRWPLRSPWLYGGIAAAAVLAAPYVIWQARNGWPQLTVASHIGGSAEGGRAGFIPFQLVMVSPLLVPIWIVGLIGPLRHGSMLRFIPVTYLILAGAYLLGNGKAYYLASLYPLLLGMGSVDVAAWTKRGSARLRTVVLSVAVVASGAISALIALPLVPATDLQGSAVMAINPDQGETVGWPRFVDTVAVAWRSLPAGERHTTAIVTANYGEAATIELLGRQQGLPRAYSGHNGFSAWGVPSDATRVILLGYDNAPETVPAFTDCRTLARIDNRVGLDNDEQGLPVLYCRPSRPWSQLWPMLRHYD